MTARWLTGICSALVALAPLQAQNVIATFYEAGTGVVQDRAQALKWYTKAAEHGYSDAEFSLGVMYDNGQGVTQDYAEAAKWYRYAAEQGYADARWSLPGWGWANFLLPIFHCARSPQGMSPRLSGQTLPGRATSSP